MMPSPAHERLEAQEFLLANQRTTEHRLRAEAEALVAQLDSAVGLATSAHESAVQAERDEQRKRELARSFCGPALAALGDLSRDAQQHSRDIATRHQRLRDAAAQHARGAGDAQKVLVGAGELAKAVEAGLSELHRTLVVRCGETMGEMDTLLSAHKSSVQSLARETGSSTRACGATVAALVDSVRNGEEHLQTWGKERLARLAAASDSLAGARLEAAAAVGGSHAPVSEALAAHSDLLDAQSASVATLRSKLSAHVDEVRRLAAASARSPTSSPGQETGEHVEQSVRAQSQKIEQAQAECRAASASSSAQKDTLEHLASASANGAAGVLELLELQKGALQKAVSAPPSAVAAVEEQLQAIEELGAAVAASTSSTASLVTELRHALSAGLRSGPMSAAQEQLDGSVRAQLEKLSTLRSGLEAAIAADLTGTGADGVEDDIVQALRGSSERLDADAGSLLACIAQQEQQLGELAMRLESLDAARQGLHGSTVASVMQGMAAVQEEKARDVAAAVTAGVETLLKTELGKMRAACEEKAGELVQQHLKQMAAEEQQQLAAIQQARTQAVEANDSIRTAVTALTADLGSVSSECQELTAALGGRMRRAADRLEGLLEEESIIVEHAKTAQAASKEWSAASAAATDAVASATALTSEQIASEATSLSRTHAQKTAELRLQCQHTVGGVSTLDSSIKDMAASAMSVNEKMQSQVKGSQTEVSSLCVTAERQATDRADDAVAIQTLLTAIGHDNASLSETLEGTMEKLVASSDMAAKAAEDLRAKEEPLAAQLRKVQELHSQGAQPAVTAAAQRWSEEATSSLGAEADAVRAMLEARPALLEQLGGMEKTLLEQLEAGATALQHTSVGAEGFASACAAASRGWENYRSEHKARSAEVQAQARSLEAALARHANTTAGAIDSYGSQYAAESNDIVSQVKLAADRGSKQATALAKLVDEFCTGTLQMNKPVDGIPPLPSPWPPQYSRQLSTTPDEDALLQTMRTERGKQLSPETTGRGVGQDGRVPPPVELFDSLQAKEKASETTLQRELAQQRREHERNMQDHQQQLERLYANLDNGTGTSTNTSGEPVGGWLTGVLPHHQMPPAADGTSKDDSYLDVATHGFAPDDQTAEQGGRNMREFDAERQELRDELAAAAKAAGLYDTQTTDATEERNELWQVAEQVAHGRSPPSQSRVRHTSPGRNLSMVAARDGANGTDATWSPPFDESAYSAQAYEFRDDTATDDPVTAALLRVVWEAIHYRRRVLWDCPVDSLASFYEVLARNAASAAKGVQRNELREGLRRLQIGLTNAQLDRLVATVRVDQFGGISFDEFSQWLHVRDSDASIIAAANVQRNEDSARHPRRTGRSPSHRAAAQAAGDRRRSRSPAAPRPKSAAKGRRSRSAPRSRRVSPHSKLEFNKPGREGVEYTGEDGQHGRPGAWDRMQSDNHTQALLAPKVQRELQRVLWQAITSRKRTLFGRPINDLEALFDAADKDSNGTISREELRAAFQRLDVGITPIQLERLVATIDADDDGGISYEELDGWMAERA